ncbi:hypothetical protein MJO29_002717 [Puccinia striiformis f. sp. tritici]|nr:hypothetical protein MJO29_002717 [Puccinia striiformis f. sp. tritici]
MRPSCLHSSCRPLWYHGPTKSFVRSQSQIRTLRQADHFTFKIRPPTFEKLTNTRTFTSTSRMLAQLGRIDVKKMPITNHNLNVTLNDDILRETRNPDSTSARKPGTWRPFVFTLGISLLAFGLAIDQTNRDTAEKIDYIRTHQGTFPSWFSKTFTGYASYLDPSDAQLQQLRKLDKLNFIKDYGLNSIFPHHLLNWYINLGEGKQICCVIALINLQIFALWQMPRFFKSMTQRFTHFPLSGRSYTLLTSTFSHSSALHFGFNMLALYSIGSTAHDYLTHRLRASRDVDPVRIPESTPTYHFLAFYVFAGLAASFGSHAYSMLIRAPRLLKWRQGLLKSSTPPSPILPSLGASGAIYGCLTMTALAFPEAHVSLIFLPWVPIKIGNAVCGAMLFDFIGVIRNWRYFDHMAHLCGGFAGVFWYFFMDKWFDVLRLKVWNRYLVKQNEE